MAEEQDQASIPVKRTAVSFDITGQRVEVLLEDSSDEMATITIRSAQPATNIRLLQEISGIQRPGPAIPTAQIQDQGA